MTLSTPASAFTPESTVYQAGEPSVGGYPASQERAWVEVDLNCLRHNVRLLQAKLTPGTEIWGVVKANAYGHGAIAIARALEDFGSGVAKSLGSSPAEKTGSPLAYPRVAGLCVATLPEGLELRQAGIKLPILLLGPLNTVEAVAIAHQHQLELTLSDPSQISICEAAYHDLASQHSTVTPIPVHLNVDTGMSRLGVPWSTAAAVWQDLRRRPALQPRSLYSHLATADELDLSGSHQQHARFQGVIAALQAAQVPLPPLHLANSAATLANPAWHYQWVRLGLALYGLAPAPHLAPPLQPVLAVKARITQIKDVPAGTGVSYGHRYHTSRPSRLATVAIGYADGVPRRLSGQLTGQVGPHAIAQVGTITMDQTVWDVTAVPAAEIKVGDVVTLIGGQSPLTVDHWATQLGTISYEIVCGLASRLPRIVLPLAEEPA